MYLVDVENNFQWMATGIWKTTDSGNNWQRLMQFTHPYHVKMDPDNPDHVYVSGGYTLDGSWGNGGAYFSYDGGNNWFKNYNLNMQSNINSVTIDPQDPDMVFYTFFGGGMVHTAKPVDIHSPTDLTAANTASGKISLSWKDNSDNESGFRN